MKWHAVLFGIHARSSNMKISEFLGVNMKTDSYLCWWKPNNQSISWFLGLVTSDCDVMAKFIFPHGLSLNMEAYNNLVLTNWESDYWKPFFWLQEFVSYHTSREIQYWLSKHFCNHITPNIWQFNFPDCNLLDYYMCGMVVWETNKMLYNTKEELKARIIAAFINFNKTIGKTCNRF